MEGGGGGGIEDLALIEKNQLCVLTLMYCQMALTITGLVCVWIPMRRASLGSSLY